MEAKLEGSAKLVVLDPRMSNTAIARRPLAGAVAGQRGGDPAGRRVPPAAYRADRPRLPAALGQLGHLPRAAAPGRGRATSTRSSTALTDDYAALHVRVRGRREPGAGRADPRAGRDRRRRPGSALSAHIWRSAAAGNLGGWQVARCLFFLNVLTGSVGTPGGTSPNGWAQVHPARLRRPGGPRRVERAAVAGGVPAVDQRDVDPAAPLPAGRTRRARRLLHPGLQPGVDQPRRLQPGSRRSPAPTRSGCTSP